MYGHLSFKANFGPFQAIKLTFRQSHADGTGYAMLCHLTIQNYTLVNELDIEFANGMTVVTGETGTGKSIMLDALALTLGSRADNAMIAQGSSRAEIHATFDIANNQEALLWLEQRDLGNDHTCILRRVINRDGRSRAFINGVPGTLNDISSFGNLLVDIHSQHEHQSLLKTDTHRRLLDEFGSLTDSAASVLECYQQHRKTDEHLQKLLQETDQGSSRLQLLNYQLGELVELNPAEGESTLLEIEQKRLANIEDIKRYCQEVIQTCTEEEDINVSSVLSRAVDRLTSIDDVALQPVIELLNSSQIQVDEAITDLKSMTRHYEADPERLLEVENRLSTLYSIARKHRVSPEELPALQVSIQKEITTLSDIDEQISMLESELTTLKKRFQKAAGTLTKQRQAAADALASAVTERLTHLGMTGAELSIQLNARPEESIHPNGHEDIEFLISTNPDQPHRPLARIASGGELSRISLAIQVVTANTSRVPTLVFDEVDAGISGAIAEVVGAQVRGLGDQAQIICVTHLPQVAAQGHHHLRVSKSLESGRTITRVIPLKEKSRIEEIARMLGGINVTGQSLAHAAEMYATAQVQGV